MDTNFYSRRDRRATEGSQSRHGRHAGVGLGHGTAGFVQRPDTKYTKNREELEAGRGNLAGAHGSGRQCKLPFFGGTTRWGRTPHDREVTVHEMPAHANRRSRRPAHTANGPSHRERRFAFESVDTFEFFVSRSSECCPHGSSPRNREHRLTGSEPSAISELSVSSRSPTRTGARACATTGAFGPPAPRSTARSPPQAAVAWPGSRR